MLEKGMAYRKESYVNWCDPCQTVLANEQVEAGMCWRCGKPVRQKKLWQWFFRITDYAEDLLVHCDSFPGWPDKVTTMQKNWIGKSLGAEIRFPIEDSERSSPYSPPGRIRFSGPPSCAWRRSTRWSAAFPGTIRKPPWTLCGSHVPAGPFRSRPGNLRKEGVFTGAYCINPMNNRRMPIYTANFALMEYGTGAVMSVPAHDQRDFDFAENTGSIWWW
jgi:leucyl-tRNA synthetase